MTCAFGPEHREKHAEQTSVYEGDSGGADGVGLEKRRRIQFIASGSQVSGAKAAERRARPGPRRGLKQTMRIAQRASGSYGSSTTVYEPDVCEYMSKSIMRSRRRSSDS